MAVKRVWYPDVPSGTIDSPQKLQILIGYPFTPNIPPIPPIPPEPDNTYFRRYLGDVLSIPQSTAAPITTDSAPSSLSVYLRRYLNDTQGD